MEICKTFNQPTIKFWEYNMEEIARRGNFLIQTEVKSNNLWEKKFKEGGLHRGDSYQEKGLVSGEFVKMGKNNLWTGRKSLKVVREKESL